MNKLLVLFGTYISIFAGMTTTVHSASTDMSADQVLADGCNTTPDNFSLHDFWDKEMQVLKAWCNIPIITKSDINGRRKPRAFAHGSTGVPHDANAVKIINGTGENGDILGVVPRTTVSLDLYCTDASLLIDASDGDVVFALREWSDTCHFMSPILPTIPAFGINNQDRFIGDQKAAYGIHISSGGSYGLGIDYFMPGGARTVLGGGNVSFGLAEFAGIVVALNTALISTNHAALDNDSIKDVLDASSDKVYLEVEGFRGIYEESQLDSLPQYKYYGQLVNLSNAIENVLSASSGMALLTTLKEVNNDNGGDALESDFILRITGGVYDGSVPRFSGDWLRIVGNVEYTLIEDGLTGYTHTGIVCQDDATAEALSHPVTLLAGQSATCTASNDDIAPEITIIKQVSNEDGGLAKPEDFTLHLSGGIYAGNAARQSGDLIVVDANTSYTLSEDPLPGYAQTGIVCVDDVTNAILDHPVTLTEGQLASCTISNADIAPELTIIKRVVNQHGGSADPGDFTLRLLGGVYDGSIPRKSGDLILVDANRAYRLVEDPYEGYSQTAIECVDGDTGVNLGHPVILIERQSVTCTISNTDYVSSFYIIPLPDSGAATIDL